MKRVNVILLVVAFLAASNMGYSRTIAPPYEVGTWQGFKTAAVTWTHDDDCSNQLAIAIPLYNQYGMKATFFLVTDWVTNWTPWATAACQGHEIASHTVTHSRLGGMSIANQILEYSNSQTTINTNCSCSDCLTIAYPNCANGDYATLAQYFIAGRNCSGANNTATPGNFFEINSYICGSRGTVKTTADFITRFSSVQTAGGWLVLLIHGIDSDGGYSPLPSTVLTGAVQYLDTNKNNFWVATFVNVACYIKERDDVSVSETTVTDTAITLAVTDTLDNTIYNYAVTLRRPLPAGWASAAVTQNGHSVDSLIVTVNSVNYVMFNVVPDGGTVVLTKTGQSQAPAAPTGLTAAAGTGTISLDWNNNNESDLAGYNVYRSITSGSGYSKLNSSLVTTSAYADNTVINGTTYYYVVTAVNTGNYESAYSGQVSATPVGGGATSMHVHSIVVTTVPQGAKLKGRAIVVIKDNNGNPVSNATVTGTFTGSFNETRTGTTDATGTATIDTYSSYQKSSVTSIHFCVTNVTGSLTYNSGANVVTCADWQP